MRVVNGHVVADEFLDWYQVLEYDRYQLACGNFTPPASRTQKVSRAQSSQPSPQGVYSGTATL